MTDIVSDEEHGFKSDVEEQYNDGGYGSDQENDGFGEFLQGEEGDINYMLDDGIENIIGDGHGSQSTKTRAIDTENVREEMPRRRASEISAINVVVDGDEEAEQVTLPKPERGSSESVAKGDVDRQKLNTDIQRILMREPENDTSEEEHEDSGTHSVHKHRHKHRHGSHHHKHGHRHHKHHGTSSRHHSRDSSPLTKRGSPSRNREEEEQSEEEKEPCYMTIFGTEISLDELQEYRLDLLQEIQTFKAKNTTDEYLRAFGDVNRDSSIEDIEKIARYIRSIEDSETFVNMGCLFLMVTTFLIEKVVTRINHPMLDLQGWSKTFYVGGTDRVTHNKLSSIFKKIHQRNRSKYKIISNPYVELGQVIVETALMKNIQNLGEKRKILQKTKRNIRLNSQIPIDEITDYISSDDER